MKSYSYYIFFFEEFNKNSIACPILLLINTKYTRLMRKKYFIFKLKNISPWLLPEKLPNDALELAKLAILQVCT